MKICAKMLFDLNFEPRAISPCCNTRALAVPAFEYAGGSIDLAQYAAHLENTLAEIQQGGKVCKNCPELRDLPDAPGSCGVRFRSVSLNMHRHFCNCKCVYCDLWNRREKVLPYDPLPALKSLKAQNALATDCVISWGGGEPGILPSFETTAAWVLANGYRQQIHTNAIRHSPVMENILREGKGWVNVSLDSGTPEIYRRVKGVNRFDRVCGNIRKYAAINPAAIQLKYIVFEENNNPAEIEKFLQFAKALNIDAIEYSLNFVEINKGAVSEKSLLAAAFLDSRAHALGFPAVRRFFIDPKWSEMIEERKREFA